MKILCVLGEHNYGDPARGECYEYVNFLPALRNLGHHTVFFESFSKACYRDFADLNRKLLETVETEKPDVILCVLLGYEIWLETFRLIREGSDAILINWSTDDSWKYEQFSRFVSPAFHIYATTYPEAIEKSKRDGHANFVLTQWAANSEALAEPVPATACSYPVSFIGTAYGNRPQWIASLKESGIAVECFGLGWENGPIPAKKIPEIMRNSVISLNFGDSATVWNKIVPSKSRQIKARVFEVPGAGGFLMTEPAQYLDRFYRIDEEIVTYEGSEDLSRKISHFLAHPEERDRIAYAGHSRTRREHTYESRFKSLLEIASELRKTREAEHCAIDFEKFGGLERKHKTGIFLSFLGNLLRFPFQLVWGRKRGPRAARRFLFEISWRVAGKKTYSASGWPGRLFYRES